ncbi:MAG: thioredoxin fold domain-containing protein [candidate division Zixibacteria bacterium]|nr:thioredoxin fold domain-containing protein [candidate division Zixibacteria bacterium]
MGIFSKLFNKPPKPGKPQPITDETFEQAAIASDTPAVVDFWSRTCPPCQVMGGLLDEIGPEYAGRVNIFKLNVSENPIMARRYQVRSIPTVVFFRRGKEIDRVVGLIPLNPLKQKIDNLIK